MEKISADELKDLKILELELDLLKTRTEAKISEFQARLDGVWAAHNMVKGVARLEADGSITRGDKSEEVK